MPVPIYKRRPTALGVHIFAGGFSCGVRQAGFEVLAHLEDTNYGVDTALANWPDLDVRIGSETWNPQEFEGRVDLLYSNPPCAIFSSAGISTTRGPDAWRDDPRLGCWYRSLDVFEAVRPRAFFLESVTQAYTKGREVVDGFTRRAIEMGYSVKHVLMDAKWTGLPQSRKRFFFVAHLPNIPLDLSYDFDDPPTVGEVLSSVLDPGPYIDKSPGANPAQYIPNCAQGERLSEVYDRENPDPPRNSRGQAKGRPSFNCRRLREDETMGAFIGNFYAHPVEDRFLGTREMRALCGYPTDFVLEGSTGGYASLLARAVLPPVGRWVATRVREAMEKRYDDSVSVVSIDLRKPKIRPNDLTSEYADRPTFDTVEPSRPKTKVTKAAAESKRHPERPPRDVSRRSEGDPTPNPGEGSGAFMRRLMTSRDPAAVTDSGKVDVDNLLRLVHSNWEGRKTGPGDVRWNWYKLRDDGADDLPEFPSGGSGRRNNRRRVGSGQRDSIREKVVVDRKSGKPTLLLTGSTPIQCGSKKTKLNILTSAACWRNAFESAGYEVDWRPVRPGEDVSNYDVVVVSLNKPNSIASGYVHGALWCLSRRPDAIAFLDDWQVEELVSGIGTCSRSKERTFRLRGGDLSDEVKDVVFKVLNEMSCGNWKWPVVVPILGDGDVSLLEVPAKRVTGVDPTPFSPRRDDPRTEKRRRWVMASLLKKRPPDAGWPVLFYGNEDKGMYGLGPSGKDAQPRIPEDELFDVYASSWGVVSPAHPHAGSGWWRVRYLMAADARCVLTADPKEASCLGEPYVVAAGDEGIRHVESMRTPKLRRLANEQRACLDDISWSRDETLDAWNDLISETTNRKTRPKAGHAK